VIPILKAQEIPSDKKFGLFFALIFFGFFAYFFFVKSKFLAFVFFILSLIFLLLAIKNPTKLHLLNLLWLRFGLLLGRIINPLVLGILFFVMITPLALFLRLLGRDELQLRNKSYQTFWKKRTGKTLTKREGFKNQF